jgi:HEAT repeat protein
VATRRKKILIALAFVVLAVSAILFFSRNTEPRYNGHPLSYWLAETRREDLHAEDQEYIRKAISQIGTNALPYLLQWLRYEDKKPPFQDNYVKSFSRRLPKKFIPRPLIRWAWGDYDEEARADTSVFAFEVLGKRGSAGIPQLIEMLNNTNHAEVPDRAAMALALMGEDGLQPLLTVLAKTNSLNRRIVADRIGLSRGLEKHATLVIPVLVNCLEEGDLQIRYRAADTLGRIAVKPLVVIPALTNCLNESAKADIRCSVTWALGRYGEHARVAMPLLLNQLTDPDLGVRIRTTNAIRAIDPNALTNSPSH